MSRLEDDLRTTLRRHAMDVDHVGGMPREVRRRAQLRRAGTAGLTGALAVAVVAATVGIVRAVHPAPPPEPTPSPPLPLVERAHVTAHGNGDLVYPLDGSLVRRAPDGRTTTWVSRSAMNEACGRRDCSITSLEGSPDGSALAIVMGVVRRTSPSTYSVYVVTDGATTPRRVFDCPASLCSNGGSVSWSPDGSSVAVSDTFAAGLGIEVVSVADPATPPRAVCTDCQAGSVTWSPDGRWLAYAGRDAVHRISVTGGASEQVVASPNVASLSWSPDGTRLLVETDTDVRTIDLSRRPYSQGTIVSGVSPSEGPARPSWAPDGRRVSWFSTPGRHRNFVAEVWTAGGDGSTANRLMRSGCCVSDWSAPVWSPDGKRLTLGLSLDPAHAPDLLILDARTGTQITRVPGQGWGPMTWQPSS